MFEERVPISVSELNEYVRVMLANDPLLRNLEVTGELSGFKRHISGHCYFSLKDENARVQCVMFRQQAMGLDFQPRDGMRVTLRASASVFVRDGSYQLYVSSMRQEGAGALYLRFEALKRKLMAEGLFDPARKRPIPFHPRIIGVATSKTGAAVRDIIRVARRRDPQVGILLAPCSVQGESAAVEIVRSIERLNCNGEAEVLLVGRGGGSMEDLWPFNEEIVARAIAASHIPVISCVGHEVDFTIADFVADVRAATPSMAAELAVPMLDELEETRKTLEERLFRALQSGQELRHARLERLTSSYALSRPGEALIRPRMEHLTALLDKAKGAEARRTQSAQAKLTELTRTLQAVGPQSVLERGYAAVKKGAGYVTDIEQLRRDDEIELVMAKGSRRARITGEELHGDQNDL